MHQTENRGYVHVYTVTIFDGRATPNEHSVNTNSTKKNMSTQRTIGIKKCAKELQIGV
jgi:hypothetical protein